MNFKELYEIKDEIEQINRTYDIFDEEHRLSSKAARVEFLTTVKYIEKYLEPGMKILDIERAQENTAFILRNKVMKFPPLNLQTAILPLSAKE